MSLSVSTLLGSLGSLLPILCSQYILQRICRFPILLPISYICGCGEQEQLVQQRGGKESGEPELWD